MKSRESKNGVIGLKTAGDEYVLIVPRELLDNLQAAWQSDAPDDFTPLIDAVRDLFDGQDGALQFLATLGVPTRHT